MEYSYVVGAGGKASGRNMNLEQAIRHYELRTQTTAQYMNDFDDIELYEYGPVVKEVLSTWYFLSVLYGMQDKGDTLVLPVHNNDCARCRQDAEMNKIAALWREQNPDFRVKRCFRYVDKSMKGTNVPYRPEQGPFPYLYKSEKPRVCRVG